MVVKPMSMLTKSSGDHGVPTSLVVNGTQYPSIKKSRSSRSEISLERDESIGSRASLDKDMRKKFERDDLDDSSMNSPELLSTKGHTVISRVTSRDELSSLRSRLASLRGSPDHEDNNLWGTIDEHDSTVNRSKSNDFLNSKKNNMFSIDSVGKDERRTNSSPRRVNGGNVHASRITTLHGSEAHTIDTRTQSRGPEYQATQMLGLEKPTTGTILGLEKLANGNLQAQESKKERSSRSRHRQENSTNGDMLIINEKDDHRSLQGSAVPEKTSNSMRQAVLEIAEKARRNRNRIHHQSSETYATAQPDPCTDHSKVETTTQALRGPSSNNSSRALDAGLDMQKWQFHEIDDVNRIHQRLQSSTEARDKSSTLLESEPLDHNQVREDSVRGFSVNQSNSQSSGKESHHRHQSSQRTHHSIHERSDVDHSSPASQTWSTRSSQYHSHNSPSMQSVRSVYLSSYERDDLYMSHRSHHASDGELSNRGQTWFAATELQSNLLVEVQDCLFHLHKFPLLSRSGRLNRLVFESRDTNNDHIKLHAMPGGPEAFELAVKFCYGIPVELTPLNIATLRCAAEYLEMTDTLEDGNLVSKTEHYLSFIVLAAWKDSITVLQSCQRLLPWAEELQIVRRCSESLAWKACTDPHGIRWSFSSNSSSAPSAVLWDGPKQTQLGKHIPHDWWIEDIIKLSFDAFSRVITAIKVKGMAYTMVGSAIAQYATKRLPGLEKRSRRQQIDVSKGGMLMSHDPNRVTGKEIVVHDLQDAQTPNQIEKRALVEGIISMLPPQQDAVSCSFLLRLLRVACQLGANTICKGELERRVGMQLEHASLSDLLIPSSQSSSKMMYDIEVVQRILEQFLLKDHSTATSPTRSNTTEKQLHLFDNGLSRPPAAPHTTKVKVAKLMDAYLAEVARDANLPLAKFQSLTESLPEFSRPSDDGLYRAIDTYLKTHPTMTEHERKKLCRVMDCQRLSLEACLHAAQNERLPLRVVVQVLFSEQVKLRNAITGNSLVRKNQRDVGHHMDNGGSPYPLTQEQSQQSGSNQHHIVVPRVDNSNAGGLSLQESWQSARRDIKSLMQEIESMKSKFSDLEQDYAGVTQQVEKLSKSKSHSMSGWTSGWRKLSSHMKSPNLFSHSKHEYDSHHNKDDDSAVPTRASTPTHDLTPTAASVAGSEQQQRRRSHSVTSSSSVQRWRNSIS